MIENLRYFAAAVLILAGIAAGAVSILGVFRFQFVMNRMHCAAILDTLAMAGILGGLMIASADWQYIPKLAAALMMLWVGSPIASHLVSRMEIVTDETAVQHIQREEDTNGSY